MFDKPGHSGMWWSLPAWKEPVHTPPRENTPVTYFNPMCKHERTSYDTVNCDACKAYSVSKSVQENNPPVADDQDNGEGFPSPY